jgi:hypothetical protein
MPESGLNRGLGGIEAFNPNNGEYQRWEDYSSRINTTLCVGWSSITTNQFYYKKLGSLVLCRLNISGTSNSTSTQITLPFITSPFQITTFAGTIGAMNNGTINAAAGVVRWSAGLRTADFFRNPGLSAWTASGTKQIFGEFFYFTEE